LANAAPLDGADIPVGQRRWPRGIPVLADARTNPAWAVGTEMAKFSEVEGLDPHGAQRDDPLRVKFTLPRSAWETSFAAMSLAEIKQEVARLTPAERHELALQLEVLRDLEDPAFLDELTQAHADAERGVADLTRGELLARLRTTGLSSAE
jgi:hypothetical protein